jgi:hypothetical protein
VAHTIGHAARSEQYPESVLTSSMAVSVYQIEYSNDVIGEFDPAFIRYDCRGNPEPEKREIAHMLRFYDEGVWRSEGSEYFGLVSPKFSGKVGISGKAFVDWVNANPGYDVYYVNPFPQLSYWYFNVWTQGESWHPGLVDLANALFVAAGFSFRVENLPRNTARSLLYSNYWVGNEKFWHTYMAFVRKLGDAVDDLDVGDRKKIFEIAPHYASATYFPFVFERLFSTFLVLHGGIACFPYHYGHDEIIDRCGNDMERFVIREWAEMIDNWDATGRDDANYRKLFANLQRTLRVCQPVAPCEGFPDHAHSKRLIEKLKWMLGLVHPR